MQTLAKFLGRAVKRSKEEKGQSLLEIVGFLVLVGILIVVFATRILGAQDSAQDKTAQEKLKRATIAAETIYSNTSTYPAAMSTALAAGGCPAAANKDKLACVDNALTIVDGGTTAATGTILQGLAAGSIRAEFGNGTGMPAGQEVVFQTVAPNGRVWCVRLTAASYNTTTPVDQGTFFGGGTKANTIAAATVYCAASHAATNTDILNKTY